MVTELEVDEFEMVQQPTLLIRYGIIVTSGDKSYHLSYSWPSSIVSNRLVTAIVCVPCTQVSC